MRKKQKKNQKDGFGDYSRRVQVVPGITIIKKHIRGGKISEKIFKKIDSEIRYGARKLSQILWLKNTKKETQLKKY